MVGDNGITDAVESAYTLHCYSMESIGDNESFLVKYVVVCRNLTRIVKWHGKGGA